MGKSYKESINKVSETRCAIGYATASQVVNKEGKIKLINLARNKSYNYISAKSQQDNSTNIEAFS